MKPDIAETLDETIDRVAAAMTQVPADDAFAQRLAARLPRHRAAASPLLFAAVGLAAAGVMAIGLSLVKPERTAAPGQPVATEVVRSTPAAASKTRADAAESLAPAQPAGVASVAIDSRAPRTRVLEELAALQGPAELSVRELDLPPLTIDPVAVESLGMANLEIAEIEGSSEFKE